MRVVVEPAKFAQDYPRRAQSGYRPRILGHGAGLGTDGGGSSLGGAFGGAALGSHSERLQAANSASVSKL